MVWAVITGPPNGPVFFARRRLSSSSVVVCNAASRRARGRTADAGLAAGRVAGPAADTARQASMVTSR